MVNFLSVDGLFVKDYEGFTNDYATNIQKLAGSNAIYTRLGDDAGYTCVLTRVVPSVPLVSPRTMIVTYYPSKEGDDHIFMISSKGNEALLEGTYKDKVVSGDVVATLDVNFMKFSPKFDSCGDIVGTEIS